MHIIKLDATDSTNKYLRQLSNDEVLKDYTVVSAGFQTHGRGQIGTVWESQAAKNLMFSVFKDVSFLKFKDSFFISIVTSLALTKTLNQFSIPKLRIKWPNDILSEDKKICGILIENVVKQDQLKGTIIGIGLNVNQTQFNDLPKASSMQLISGINYDLDELLLAIIDNLRYYFSFLNRKEFSFLKEAYEKQLFRREKPSTFKDISGNMFSGFIKGIGPSGNLQVLLEDDILSEFDLKEISLLY